MDAARTKETKPNLFLRQERMIRGWSQSKVAEEVGTNTDTVSKWERGINVPDSFFREKLCNLYTKNAIELGFLEEIVSLHSSPLATVAYNEDHESQTSFQVGSLSQEEEGDMDQSRRWFLGKSLKLASAAIIANSYTKAVAATPWEKLSMAVAKPATLDASTLTSLQAITKNYWSLRANISSQNLLHSVSGHLETLTQLLRSTYPEIIKKHLCSIASETAQIAGQMSFDLNDYSSAEGYYRASIEAAQEAGNDPLLAVALGRMSFLPIYNDDPRAALSLLQPAHRIAKNSGTTITRAWLSAIEAEALASTGTKQDVSACLRSLEESEIALTQKDAKDDDPYATGFSLSRLAGYQGVCFIKTNQSDAAITVLTDAVSSPMANRRKSTILIDLASAYALRGDLGQACKYATEALEITAETKSGMVLQRIQNFRHQFASNDDCAELHDLDQTLLLMSL